MKIKMELISDAIFGNGASIPGGEDIAVLSDEYGFPYYKGGTFKGVFREELNRYLNWTGLSKEEIENKVTELLGKSGDDSAVEEHKLVFSDFCISDAVKECVIEETGQDNPQEILDSLTHLRTFISISEDGMVEKGSLRMARCVNRGLCFYSNISCRQEDGELVKEVLSLIKWIGTMRNRGFGKVKISVAEQGENDD